MGKTKPTEVGRRTIVKTVSFVPAELTKIDVLVRDGKYAGRSDVVRHALRKLFAEMDVVRG